MKTNQGMNKMDVYQEMMMGMKNSRFESFLLALDDYIDAKIKEKVHKDWSVEPKTLMDDDMIYKRDHLEEQFKALLEENKT